MGYVNHMSYVKNHMCQVNKGEKNSSLVHTTLMKLFCALKSLVKNFMYKRHTYRKSQNHMSYVKSYVICLYYDTKRITYVSYAKC